MRQRSIASSCLKRILWIAFALMLLSVYIFVLNIPMVDKTIIPLIRFSRTFHSKQQNQHHRHQQKHQLQNRDEQKQLTEPEWLDVAFNGERNFYDGDGTCQPSHDVTNLRGILKRWHDIATENNITYFLTYGSLIGAARDGQFIPWDTDLDVHTEMRDNLKLDFIKDTRDFESHSDDFHLVLDVDWRVAPVASRRRVTCDGRLDIRDSCTFNGPVGRLIRGYEQYLDIWDVEHVNGKVYDRYGQGFYYEEEDIYPLKKCTLSGITTWCPRNPKVIFDAFYGKDINIAPEFICRWGQWVKNGSIELSSDDMVIFNQESDTMIL